MLKTVKNKKFWAVMAVIFSGIGTKYLPDFSSETSEVTDNKPTSKTSIENSIILITKQKLPYLSKSPILDGNLFIEQDYNDFVFGGVNFKHIELAFRAKDGNVAELENLNNQEIRINVREQPHIEFSYKKLFYSIDIFTEVFPPDFVSYHYELKQIKEPTMYISSPQELSTQITKASM